MSARTGLKFEFFKSWHLQDHEQRHPPNGQMHLVFHLQHRRITIRIEMDHSLLSRRLMQVSERISYLSMNITRRKGLFQLSKQSPVLREVLNLANHKPACVDYVP